MMCNAVYGVYCTVVTIVASPLLCIAACLDATEPVRPT